MFRERMNGNRLDEILAASRSGEDSESKFYQLIRVDNAEHFLELRFRDGIRTAFAYEKLEWFNLSPETNMLDMDFMGTTVSIEGRGLGELFVALKGKKVSWIKEADTDLEDHEDNVVFIQDITILPPPPPGYSRGSQEQSEEP